MNPGLLAFLVLAVAVAAVEFGAAYLPLYVGHGRHRQLSPAARLRQMRARRVRVRVHQPIPQPQLAVSDDLVEAAAAKARRDRDALIAGLGQIGQPAR